MTRKKSIIIYSSSIVVAIIFSIIAYLAMPKKYCSRVRLADEPTEMDIIIGLNRMIAGNSYKDTFRDPDIYNKILDSDDFLSRIGKVKLGKTLYFDHVLEASSQSFIQKLYDNYLIKYYGISNQDLFKEKVRNCIKHEVKKDEIVISVEDADRIIAAQMADSVQKHLQIAITEYKTTQEEINITNSRRECERLNKEYKKSLKLYTDFLEANSGKNTPSFEIKKNELQKRCSKYFELLKESTRKHLRAEALSRQNAPSFCIISNPTVSNDSESPSLFIICSVSICIMLLMSFWYIKYKERKNKDNITEFGNWFSPWSLTILIWILIILLIHLEGNKLYPLTEQFYISISLWIPILCSVAFITFNLLHNKTDIPKASLGIDVNTYVYNFFFIISVLLTPLYVWQVYKIVSMFSAEDMLNNIRVLATHGEGAGWLKYTVVINQALFLVSLWRYPKIPLWKLATVYLCNIICALSIMEKGTLFTLGICTLFYLYEKGKIKVRTIAISGIAIVALFYFFTIARESTGESESNIDFAEFIGMYVTSPPVAFCQCVRDLSGQIGSNTFEVFYDYLNRFGIGNFNVLSKEQAFVMVPVITNVYTVMQPFYIDFGYYGVAFFAMIYGCICGVLYHLHKKGNPTGICLYTFLVQILILQFYQENIFMSISGLMQLVVLVILMTQNKISFSFGRSNV